MRMHQCGIFVFPLLLAACATTQAPRTASQPAAPQPRPAPSATPAPAPATGKVSPYTPAQEDLSKRGDYVAGGLFRPGVPDTVPDEIPDVDAIPEPEVRSEPRAATGNKAYTVLGQQYRVLSNEAGFAEEGLASYYGNKFHGRRTSSQEVYDMYAFTAAHKTLPLPSFARVTNLDNGKSIVVRVNDRGPFHKGRVVDLSYAAAVKLGYREKGVARVRVEALVPETEISQAQNNSAIDKLIESMPTAGVAPAKQDVMPQMSVAASAPVHATAEQVVLQVASYSSQHNAQEALQRLQAAAISQAQLHDADVNGRKVWRLRIGPVSELAMAELTQRIVGLGFSAPQRVRN